MDIEELSRINEARDTIMALERDGEDGRGRVFIVPLEPNFLTPHTEWPSQRLVPLPRPSPSQTSHLLEVAVQRLRSEAIREVAPAATPDATANGG